MERIHERDQFSVLVPQSATDAAVTSSYVSMKDARRLCVVLASEALGAAETVKVEILEATSAAGANAQAIDGATTTLTNEAGGPAIIEVHTDNMTDGYTHLAVKATVTGTALISATLIKSDLSRKPADQTGVVVAPQI